MTELIPTTGPGARAADRWITATFAVCAIAMSVDVSTHIGLGAGWTHVALECLIMGSALTAIAWARRLLRRRRDETHSLRAQLVQARTTSATWQHAAITWRTEARAATAGLGEAIDRELTRWGLSAAEHEVALLLLKGLAHKEIAVVRGVTERTTRQQARAIYRKGGITGRHELSAYFLEDLLAPVRDGAAPSATERR